MLAALGVPTLLLANDIGDDQKGSGVCAWLRHYGVNTTARVKTDTTTPQIVVVADDDGTRTWFLHLTDARDSLAAVDLSPLLAELRAIIGRGTASRCQQRNFTSNESSSAPGRFG